MVYLHVVVGEMIPKNLAIAGPERAALALASPLVGLARALAPLIRLLTVVTNGSLRLLRVEPKAELASAFTVEEVGSIVAESHREGLLDDEHELLTGALELGERRAGDVMVPLGNLVTVVAGSTPAEVEGLVRRTGFSRFPVVASRDGRADDPVIVGHRWEDASLDLVGYLHIKDLLYADDARHAQPVPEKRIRVLVTAGASDELEDVLVAMQRSGAHLARVVADDGSTNVGVVFLEDVLEELVGEVMDATQHPDVGKHLSDRRIVAP